MDHAGSRASTSLPGPPRTSAPTATTVPGWESLAAQATVARLGVYGAPGDARPQLVLDNPWRVVPNDPASAVPQVFLVERQRADGWIQVLLPVRPNGTSGWLRAGGVALMPIGYRITVQLGTHRITVYDQGAAIYEGPVAVGARVTPTPTGHYYIRVLLKANNPNTVYGPFAYGLSSHSDALSSFDGGDAEIGLHGNNDASVLGRDVTHGCIRMDNDEIVRLAASLPLGTPVDVEP